MRAGQRASAAGEPGQWGRRIDTEALKRDRPLADVVEASGVPLRRGSRGLFWALCPFHQEKTPSFAVDVRDAADEHVHCFGCLPPGALVKTQDGMRPIEEIVEGDLVYAGDGKLHPVIKTHEHTFNGDLVRLVCAPFKVPLLLTPNHRVPVMRRRSRRVEQVPAGELRAQNALLYPAMRRASEPLSWTLERGLKTHGRRPRALPDGVDPSALAEWLGWYLAEGSVSGDRVVRFSLGAHERPQADRLRELTYVLFGCELRVVQAGSSIEASFCHALLGRWLKQQCGNGAHSKRLPSFVWQWSSADQWRLFHGLMLGDGEMPDGVALFQGRTLRKQWRLGLASPTLIDDVRDLLLLNGVRPTSLVEERAPDGRRVWRLWIPADVEQAWGRLAGTVPVLVRVRKVDRVPYAGPVHNLTVAEDHTYVTFSGTVCNCGFHGDVISYVMARESCTFLEACERLAVRGRPPMAHPLPAERGPRVERRWETLAADSPEGRVMQLASQTYQQQLWAAPYALQYLRQRAVPLELAREQQVGYADGRSLLARLRRAGVDAPTGRSLLEIAEELGLVVARPAEDGTGKRYHEFFFRRLIVPELRGGCAIWFIGRTIELPPPPGQPVADDQRRAPKYLSLGGERPVFGLEAVVGRPAAYLVEGPFDWLAARAWQLPAFSICGTHFPQERLPVLDAAVAIYGVFDPDRAGRSAAERFAPLFGDRWRPVRLPNGLDLAEVAALGPAGREMFDALVGRARAEAWLGTGAS